MVSTTQSHKAFSDKVRISVVMPAYNYAHLLSRALDSVMSQWAEDLELLVVNDGSTDDTAVFLKNYFLDDARKIRVIHQANAGPAAARNQGIRRAEGRFVLMLDADDELMPGAMDLFRKVVTDNPKIEMVLGGHFSVDYAGKEHENSPGKIGGSTTQLVRKYLLTKDISMCHGSVLFRRDVLLERLYPEHIRGSEDIPVFTYMLARGSVSVIRQPLVRTYRHQQSLRTLRENEEMLIDDLVEETFLKLPASCQTLKKHYRAQRYLSLFRSALLKKDKATARNLYSKALRTSLRQALRWNYLRRIPKLW